MWYIGDDSQIPFEHEDGDFYSRKSPVLQTISKDAFYNEFAIKCKDKNKGLSLFGTVAPPKKFGVEQVNHFANIIGECIRNLKTDSFVVYDIQEEKSRSGEDRPFPFVETHEPRMYCKMLQEIAHNSEGVLYRALTSGQSEDEFREWCKDTINNYNVKNMVIVGGWRQKEEFLLSVNQASKIVKELNPSVMLGGVTIPERHRDKGDEHIRLYEKQLSGVSFFNSQIVYSPDNVISMLHDYDNLTKEKGIEPVRVLLTFAPFGSENTVTFFRWLGVEVPLGTVKRVLSRPTLQLRVEESIEICRENWKHVLDAVLRKKINVPIGFSVEAVTKSKTEQEAALKLFDWLKEEMDLYYIAKNKCY